MTFLTQKNIIDEFSFWSNEKHTTKIEFDTIRRSFVTGLRFLKICMKNILISQDLIEWKINQIKRFKNLKKRIVWRIFHSFLNQKKSMSVRVNEKSCHRKTFASSKCNETSKWWKKSKMMNVWCDEENTF